MASYTSTPHRHHTNRLRFIHDTKRFIHDDHPSILSLYSFHLNHQFISIIEFILSRSSIHFFINPFYHSIHSISIINPFHLSITSFYSFHLNYQSLILILIFDFKLNGIRPYWYIDHWCITKFHFIMPQILFEHFM